MRTTTRIAGGLTLAAGLTLGTSGLASADDVEHYSGKPAETLEQAVANLGTYNKKLEKILAKEELTPGDMEQVHKLTYTLENALKRIHSEVGQIAGKLETVHQASERREPGTVSNYGQQYLDKAKLIAP